MKKNLLVTLSVSGALFFSQVAWAGKEGCGCCGSCGSGFCWKTAGWVALWMLVSSGLLFFSWNHVIVAHTKMKKGKFWQALLLVVTLASFLGPRYLLKKGFKNCGGSCHYSAKAHHHEKH